MTAGLSRKVGARWDKVGGVEPQVRGSQKRNPPEQTVKRKPSKSEQSDRLPLETPVSFEKNLHLWALVSFCDKWVMSWSESSFFLLKTFFFLLLCFSEIQSTNDNVGKVALYAALLLFYFSLRDRNSDTTDHLLNLHVPSWLVNKLSSLKPYKVTPEESYQLGCACEIHYWPKQHGEVLYWDFMYGHRHQWKELWLAEAEGHSLLQGDD